VTAFATAADGCRLFYRIDGPAQAPPLLFAHALGTTHAMWDAQAAALAAHYRIVRYDARGHGRSDVPAGPYSIDQLADDAIAVLDAAAIERAAFCGLSLGGMIGESLGARHSQRFTVLVLANTAAIVGPAQIWNDRIAAVNSGGMAALRAGILERWFTPEFRAAQPAVVAGIGAQLDATDPAGYAAACAAVRDMDQRAALRDIRLPVLVIVGSRDPSTPPADGEYIAAQIPGARLVALEAAHISNLERGAQFTAAVADALAASA
jgi:3-oxoadipate enol-lactonase